MGARPAGEAHREAAAHAANGQHLTVGDLHGRVSRQLVASVAPQLLGGDAAAPEQAADLRGPGVGRPTAVDHERAQPCAAEHEGGAQPGGAAAHDDGVVRGVGRGTAWNAEGRGARRHGDGRREATAARRSRRWRQPHPRDGGTPRALRDAPGDSPAASPCDGRSRRAARCLLRGRGTRGHAADAGTFAPTPQSGVGSRHVPCRARSSVARRPGPPKRSGRCRVPATSLPGGRS